MAVPLAPMRQDPDEPLIENMPRGLLTLGWAAATRLF